MIAIRLIWPALILLWEVSKTIVIFLGVCLIEVLTQAALGLLLWVLIGIPTYLFGWNIAESFYSSIDLSMWPGFGLLKDI